MIDRTKQCYILPENLTAKLWIIDNPAAPVIAEYATDTWIDDFSMLICMLRDNVSVNDRKVVATDFIENH